VVGLHVAPTPHGAIVISVTTFSVVNTVVDVEVEVVDSWIHD
jgi:hypothetical protein